MFRGAPDQTGDMYKPVGVGFSIGVMLDHHDRRWAFPAAFSQARRAGFPPIKALLSDRQRGGDVPMPPQQRSADTIICICLEKGNLGVHSLLKLIGKCRIMQGVVLYYWREVVRSNC